jgi:PAS domain S-box-containing protein
MAVNLVAPRRRANTGRSDLNWSAESLRIAGWCNLNIDERNRLCAEFFEETVGNFAFDVLDILDDVYFFVKDAERRFVYYNEPFARVMWRKGDDLLGLRDEDISPEYLVDKYRSDDQNVLSNGARLVDLIELMHNKDGSYDWFTTTKFPIRSRTGQVIGVAGVIRMLTRSEHAGTAFLTLGPAIELIMTSYHRGLSVQQLSAAVSLSPSQFARQFKKRFGMTPHSYLRSVRMMAACNLLASTPLTISDVATRCGYFDQSHLTHDFITSRGMSPGQYRAMYSPANVSGPFILTV